MLLIGVFASAPRVWATDLDVAFDAGVRRFGAARAVAVQADGKVVVGGIFSFTDGMVSAGNLARFNADGSLDTAFRTATGTGANGPIYALTVHTDGKIYLAGNFTSFNGTPRNRVARLNSDGTLDDTFDPGTGPNGVVIAMAVQSDGKPVIGGQFTSVASTVRNRVARLNTNGTHDTTFANITSNNGANGTVWDLTLDSSGRAVIVGEFTSVHGTTRNRIARLTTSGALDTTIAFTGGTNGAIFTVEVDSAGLFYIGGAFNTYNGTTRNGLARLTTAGALDTAFATGAILGSSAGTAGGSYLTGLKLDSQGRVLITGNFGSYDGYSGENFTGLGGFLRLTTTGARDTTFVLVHDDYQSFAGSAPQAIAVATGDAVLIGGYFFDTVAGRGGVTQLTSAGARDPAFAGVGAGLLEQPFVDVRPGSGGKYYLLGLFDFAGGKPRHGVARFLPSGQIDEGFRLSGYFGDPHFNNAVTEILELPDGDLWVFGSFTEYSGVDFEGAVRFSSFGGVEFDATVNELRVQGGHVRRARLDANGGVILAGTFTGVSDVARPGVARVTLGTGNALLPDTGFNAGSGPVGGTVWDFDFDSTGRLLVAGEFTSFSGTTESGLVRLSATGALDTAFAANTALNGGVIAVDALANGQILIGGTFTNSGGFLANRLDRLNADGTSDANFIPGTGMNGYVRALALDPFGNIAFTGGFTTVRDEVRYNVGRLGSNGAADALFAADTIDPLANAYGLLALPDGKFLVSGGIRAVNGALRPGVARFHGSPVRRGDVATAQTGLSLANNAVRAILPLSDGRTLVVGAFTTWNGATANRVVVVDRDGYADPSVSFGVGFGSTVNGAIVEPDGKLLLYGAFTTYNDASAPYLVRLNADGTRDTTFTPPSPSGEITAVLRLPDGRYLIAGAFSTLGGVSTGRLARLNANGTRDTTFNAGAGANGTIHALARASDGTLYAGGAFQTFAGVASPGLVRLSADGARDDTFAIGSGIPGSESVRALHLQSDGRLLVGGEFSSFGGVLTGPLVRLNTDGTRDTGFMPGGNANFAVFTFLPLAQGGLAVGGRFTTLGGGERRGFAVISDNGQVNPVFDVGTGFTNGGNLGDVYALAQLADGRLAVGGIFTHVNGVARNRFALLYASYEPAPVATGSLSVVEVDPGVEITIQSGTTSTAYAYQWFKDGERIAGATSPTYTIASPGLGDEGVYTTRISNGAGETFTPGTEIIVKLTPVVTAAPVAQAVGYGSGATFSVTVAGPGPFTYQWYRNGEIVNGATSASYTVENVGAGDFGDTFHVVITNAYGQTPTSAVALTFDPNAVPGSVSTAFLPPTISGSVNALARTADGKLYVGTSSTLVRLNADGSADSSFVSAVTGQVRAIAAMTDGRVVVAGQFSITGVGTRGVARLNSDGSLDATFTPAQVQYLVFAPDFYSDSSAIYALAVDASNRVYVGGDFDRVAGTNRQNLARLTATGALDTGFAPVDNASGPDQPVRALLVQGSNLIVAGDFTLYRNAAHNRLVRVNASNAIDGTFAGGTRANGAVLALTAQADGKLLVGGTFTTYNGTARNRLARLDANGNLDTTFAPVGGPQIATNDEPAAVNAIAAFADGTIVAAGYWRRFGDWPSVNAVRLTATGAVDRQWGVTPSSSFGNSLGSATRTLLGLPDGRLVVSNLFGNTLLRLEGGSFPPELPSVLRQPSASTAPIVAGSRVEMHSLATGPGTMTYQWYRNGTPIAGATSPFFALRSVRAAEAGTYTMRATSSTTGMVETTGVVISVLPEYSGPGTVDLTWTLDPPAGLVRTAVYGANGSGGNAYYLITSPPGAGNRAMVYKHNADGTEFTASTFDVGTGFETTPAGVVVQPDGKLIAGGSFADFNGTARTGLARLNVNGTLDTAFNPVLVGLSGGTPSVGALALQSDGKLVFAGSFSTVGGTARASVARLLTSGALDTGFTPGAHNLRDITHVLINGSGQIYLLGSNTSTFEREIVRLTSSGALDNGFPRLAVSSVNDMTLDSAGRLIVAGNFTSIGGLTIKGIARFSTAGVVDPAFGPVRSSGSTQSIQNVRVGPDGYVYFITGNTTYDGISIGGLGRLDPNGKLDVAFPADGVPRSSSSQTKIDFHEGRLVLSGPGTLINPRASVVRVNMDLLPVTAPALVRSSGDRTVGEGLTLSHSALFTGSSSLTYTWTKDSVPLAGAASSELVLPSVSPADAGTYVVTATNAAGSAQATFTLDLLPADPLAPVGGLALSTGVNGTVISATRMADGRTVLAGSFSTLNGTTSRGLARLNADGTHDTAFSAALPFSSTPSIASAHTLSDGKIIVTGYLPLTGQASAAGLIRLQATGALDAVFLNESNLTGGSLYSLRSLVQSDGRIVVAGTFTSILGVSRSGLARLNANGTLDTTYATGGATVGNVQFLLDDGAGRVLVAGSFSSVGGVNPQASFFRLNADGTLDATYDGRRLALPTGGYRTADGDLFVWGPNQQITAASVSPLARVLPDGSIDSTFLYPHNNTFNSITRLAEDALGRLYAVTSSHLLRLLPGGGIDRFIPVSSGNGIFNVGGSLLYTSGAATTSINGVYGFAGVTYLNAGAEEPFALASSPPRSVTVHTGAMLELRGDFRSSAEAALQWFKDGQPIAGATSRLLLIESVATTDAGDYTLVATRAGVERTSAPSTVTVLPPSGRAGAVDPAWGRGLVVSNFNTSYTDSAGNTFLLGPVILAGAPQRPLQALDALGRLRTDFTLSSRITGFASGMLELPDGKFLLWGSSSFALDGTAVSLLRILPDGAVDPSFTPAVASQFGSVQPPTGVARLADGRLLLAGNFSTFNGQNVTKALVRLSADGVHDTTYAPGDFAVSGATLLPAADGKWWLAGSVSDPSPTNTQRYQFRLNADGTLDPTYRSRPANSYESRSAFAGASGEIYYVLRSSSFSGGGEMTFLRRVGADGAFDPSFLGPVFTRADNQSVFINTVQVDAAGRILIAGSFDRVDGVVRGSIVRLLSDGRIDPSFVPATRTSGVSNPPGAIHFAPGRIILTRGGIQYGGFTDRSGAVSLLMPELAAGTAPVVTDEAGTSVVLEPYTTLSLGLPVYAPATAQVQWYRNGEPLAGATGLRYRVARASAAHSGQYHAVVTTPGGQVTTPVISVTVPPSDYAGGLSARNGAADIQGFVRQVIRQPDGKFLVLSLGAFVDGQGPYHLFRLNADGSFHSGLPTELFNFVSSSIQLTGNGPDTLALDADGRIYVAGDFNYIEGVLRKFVARLLPDGTLDTTWDPGTGPNFRVSRVLPLPDGKAIIVGQFTTISGTARNRIARLNADGTHDVTFDPGTGANSTINQILRQSDGKLVIGGVFSNFAGISTADYIARLEADGAIDPTFVANFTNNVVTDFVRLSDGRYALAGSFTSVNSTTRRTPTVLSQNGELDPVTLTNYGNGAVIAVGANDDLYVSHSNVVQIVRYPGAAATDTAFANSHTLRGTFNTTNTIATLLPVGDELLVAGVFHALGGKPRWGLVWLSTSPGDGTPQITTTPISQTVTVGRSVTFTVAATSASGGLTYLWTKDGDPTVLSTSTTLTLPSVTEASAGTYRVAITNSAGLTEASAVLTVNPAPPGGPGAVRLGHVPMGSVPRSYAIAPDGSTLAITAAQILRINPSTGAVLGPYLATTPLNGNIDHVLFDEQGRAYVSGSFRTMNGLNSPGIARFLASGEIDPTFLSGLTPGDTVYAVAPVPGGGVYVGGNFTEFLLNGRATRHLARLTDTGALDPAFDPRGGANNYVELLHLLADGRLLVAGNFNSIASAPRSGLVRFHPDGSLDPTFNNIAVSGVRDLEVLPDGRLLIAHQSASVDGLARPGMTRLSADGVVDLAFLMDRTVIEWPIEIVLRPDGRIVATGYRYVSGLNRYYLAQFLADGSLDPSFDSSREFFNVAFNGTVSQGSTTSLFADPDGDLFVLGNFNRIDDGINRTNTVRIHGSPVPPVVYVAPAARTVESGAQVVFTVAHGGTPGFTYQWRRNGDPIDGATSATLTLASVTPADEGAYSVTITNAVDSVTTTAAALTVVVTQQAQTITFDALPDVLFSANPITLTATSTSGLTVVFEVISGEAEVSGDQLTLLGTGSITIRATQPGNASWLAATPVDRTFTVGASFSSWLVDNFTPEQIANSTLTGPNADFDRDGYRNLVEYALGLDPKVASRTGLPEVTRTTTDWTFTYTRPAARTDVTYIVQSSTNLTTWTDRAATRIVEGATETWRVTVPVSGNPNLFFRLKVTR